MIEEAFGQPHGLRRNCDFSISSSFSRPKLVSQQKKPVGSLLGVRLDDYDDHAKFNTSRQKDSSEEVQIAPSLWPEVRDEAKELQDT